MELKEALQNICDEKNLNIRNEDVRYGIGICLYYLEQCKVIKFDNGKWSVVE